MGQDQERGDGAAGTAPGPREGQRVSDADLTQRIKSISDAIAAGQYLPGEGFEYDLALDLCGCRETLAQREAALAEAVKLEQRAARLLHEREVELANIKRIELADARASLERVTGELAEAREHATACSNNSTETEREAQGLRAAVERVTQERDELVAEAKDDDAVRLMMGDILTRVANALKGEPDSRSMHDWSDLPKLAADAVRRAETAEQATRERVIGDVNWIINTTVDIERADVATLRERVVALSAPAVAGAPQTPDNERPGSVPMRGPEVSGAAESAPTVSERAAAPVSTASLSAESPNTAGGGVTTFRGPSLLEQTIEEGRADIEAGRVVWGVDPTAPVSTDATPSREALLAQVAALRDALSQYMNNESCSCAGTADMPCARCRVAIHEGQQALVESAATAAEYERARFTAGWIAGRDAAMREFQLQSQDYESNGARVGAFGTPHEVAARKCYERVRALATPTEPSR